MECSSPYQATNHGLKIHHKANYFSAKSIKKLCHSLDIHPKKSLGQHYLIRRWVLAKIISAASFSPQDTVVEVGPGLGILTRELILRVSKVIAVELDEKLCSWLRETLTTPKLTVIQGDVLSFPPESLVGGEPYKVVANLPYYITSPVLRHFLETKCRPKLMVVMVQREVAEAITGKEGETSLLGTIVKFFGQPQIVAYVPPQSFYPPPKVESAILRIEVKEEPPLPEELYQSFFQLVAAGLAAPRKKLSNSLSLGLRIKPKELTERLKGADIDLGRRPATLSIEEWLRLWRILRAEKSEFVSK